MKINTDLVFRDGTRSLITAYNVRILYSSQSVIFVKFVLYWGSDNAEFDIFTTAGVKFPTPGHLVKLV